MNNNSDYFRRGLAINAVDFHSKVTYKTLIRCQKIGMKIANFG